MAVGIAKIVTDKAEKTEALRIICQRFLPQHMDAFDAAIERSLERTAVVKITLTEPPTCKRKQYDRQGEEMKWRCSLTSTKVKITNLSPIFIRIDYFCNKV
jgi:hypothetical protein